MKISDYLVLLPAFNEENTIHEVIEELSTIFPHNQIVLADDGSTDKTSKIARKIGVRIIRNKNNRGKGHILRNAFTVIIKNFPNVKWVITVDADGQHDIQDIPRFFQTIHQNPETEIVIGKREYYRMPPINRISNKLTSNWSNYWLNWNLQDLQCGFRCYKTNALSSILEYGLKRNNFDLETEILLVSWILDLKVIDIPVRTLYPKNQRKSRIQPLIDSIRWMLLVIEFGFSLRFINKLWQRRFLRKF